MNISLEDKRALVTGGNSGLGAAIALALADAGAKVAINYVTHPEAAEGSADDQTEARRSDINPGGCFGSQGGRGYIPTN